jgi:hypothetical protein
MSDKYIVGTKLKYNENGDIGVIVENVKFAGDICVEWSMGEFSSYDEWWLDENTTII